MEIWIGISLLIYLLVMIALGTVAQRNVNTEEDFLVAGRKLPLWLAWGTLLATWFGAATVLSASDVARDEGLLGTILDPFAAGLALIVAGLFYAKPLWEMKLLTTGDLFAHAYGPKTEILSSLVQSTGYFPWIAAQYIALGTVLHHYFLFSLETGVLIAAILVLFLTMIGGMWSVTLTDTLQILIVLFGLLVLFIVMMSHLGNGSIIQGLKHSWLTSPEEHRMLMPDSTLAAVLIWSATWVNGIFGNIPGQDLMQRVFAAKNSMVAKQACLLAGILYLLFGLLPVMIGLFSGSIISDHVEQGIMFVLADLLLSTPLTCLFVVAIVSVIVSTCTSAVLSPSALLGHNLLGHIKGLRLSQLTVDRFSVLVVTACSLPLAFAGQDILDLLDVAFEIALIGLFVPFTMAIYAKPKGELSGLLSVIAGLLVWLIHRSFPWGGGTLPFIIPTEFSGLTASLIGYFSGQALTPPQRNPENHDP